MSAASLVWALAAAAGALLALQAPANAMLGRALGSPAAAALVSFLVGSAALAAVVLAAPARPDGGALRTLPWFAWAGGLLGAFAVAVAAFAAPRIGVAGLLAALVAGQLAAALLLDHFGALGLARQPLGAGRAAGLALVVLGAMLVRRG